jgi:exodeoxyribonuclease-5
MQWTQSQRNAIYKILAWLKAGIQPVFTLYGFAGTGKTTILSYLARHNVRVAAYTGKAALVLRRNGCPASTIHSMIYRSYEDLVLLLELTNLESKRKVEGGASMDNFIRIQEIRKILSEPKFELNPDAFTKNRDGETISPPNLIAIDEASMVDEEIGTDLLSFGIPLLVVMDPAQLLPIKGEPYFLVETPDVMLTEIHRQAWDSGIIRMATAVRMGQKLYNHFGTDAQLTRAVPTGWYLDPELQLICGKHVTRFKYNGIARAGFGFTHKLPVVGDRLCCGRNDYSLGLLNGSFWRVLGVDYLGNNPFLHLYLESLDNDLADDGEPRKIECYAHKRPFLEAKPEEAWMWHERIRAQEFNYGYAITCHRAQGSGFKKVVLLDESYLWGDPHQRWQGGTRMNWLYTGITRASEQLVVVKM